MKPTVPERLASFLVDAKCSTYAVGNDSRSQPALLRGSKQLDYQDGQLLYRDIYFGSIRFTGQETVYNAGLPIWAMSYAGGMLDAIEQPASADCVYSFLRQSLMHVPLQQPYRGPSIYRAGSYVYSNETHGELAHFWGVETIMDAGRPVYALRYQGGLVR